MFLSDPGGFVGGKTENESPEIQSQYVGMWLEYVWVIDRAPGRHRGMDPDVRSVASWSYEKQGTMPLPVLSRQP